MHLPTYKMPVREIILVEPGAHLQNGHYREKLSLWVKGFRFAGWNVSVACLEKPEPGFLCDVIFRPVPRWWKRVERLLPNRIRIPWLVFGTFFFAFRFGKKLDQPVLGLTTSTLLPVAAARLWTTTRTIPFAQILMYGNSFEGSGLSLKRALECASLYSLLRAGAVIFPNTDRTRKSLLRKIKGTKFRDRVVTLYDPIYIPKTSIRSRKKEGKKILLVPGPDTPRRCSLSHLANSRLMDPPDTIWIHAPGCRETDILQERETDLKWILDIRVSTDYKHFEAFAELFASATWCLIAYDPIFIQGSGLLAQAIAVGTPVLCSRFPHAEELFARFGRLGELFTFRDMDDFRRAWSTLRNWTSEQWQEFHHASSLLADGVNAECITRRVVEYFSGSSVR
jgi:hypothetical protein